MKMHTVCNTTTEFKGPSSAQLTLVIDHKIYIAQLNIDVKICCKNNNSIA